MRHGKGTDLPGMPHSQGAHIGVIYVAPDDDRKTVLTAILAEERLKREQIVLVLPQQNKAFQRPEDFDDLKMLRRKLQAELIFVTPPGPGPADFARQRRFAVFSTVESFVRSFKTSPGQPTPAQPSKGEKKGGLFGGRNKVAPVAAAGAVAGVVAGEVVGKEETPRRATQTGRRQGVMPDSDVSEQRTRPVPQKSAEPFTPLPPQTPRLQTEDEDPDTSGELPESIKPRAVVSEHDDQNKPGIHNVGPAIIEIGLSAPDVVQPTLSTDQGAGRGSNSNNVDDWDISGSHEQEKSIPSTLPNTPAAMGTDTASRKTVSKPLGPSGLELPQPRVTVTQVPPTPPPVTPQPTPSRRNTGKMAAAGVLPSNAPATGKAPVPPTSTTSTGKIPTAPSGGGRTLTPAGNIAANSAGWPPRRTPPSNRNGRPVIIVALVIVILLILFGGGWAALASGILHLPSLNPSATITITPASQPVQADPLLMQGIKGKSNIDNGQVNVHSLPSNQQTAPQQVMLTHFHQDPQPATGSITFTNTSPNTLTVTRTTTTFQVGNVQIALNEDAVIPAATLGNTLVPGQIMVPAHVLQPGTAGNIATRAINQFCCGSTNITAQNQNAFTGGTDTVDYNYLKPENVTKVVNDNQSTLQNTAQKEIRGQMNTGEQLLGNIHCDDPKTTQDIQPNVHEPNNVTVANVTVHLSCNAQVFDGNAVQTIAQKLGPDALKKKASQDPNLGSGYIPVGNMVTQIQPQTQQDGGVTFQVTVKQLWYYPWTNTMKQGLLNKIKGMSKAQAQTILNSYPGVGNAKIDIDALPSDVNQIKLDVQKVNGL